MKAHLLTLAITTITGLGLSACGSDDDNNFGSVVTGDTVILTNNGVIATINKTAPDVLVSTRTVTGLLAGDQLVGIDYRPKDGKLYAVGLLGNIYTLDASTGRATFAVALSADSTDATLPYSTITANSPEHIAVDFNPVADRLRVITDTGLNLRINVDTGATITDTALAGGSRVSAAAYTNSAAGTVATELYDINESNDTIVLQNPPNDGTLSASAALGVNVDGGAAFDIDAANNKGYAALKVNNSYGFYSIDLNTIGTANNAATVSTAALNNYFSSNGIRGLALKPNQNAGSTAVGLSANNQLIKFVPSTPNTVSTVAVTGLGSGETLVGIDYRLRTATAANVGVLYGLTRNSSNVGKIYSINTSTGAATLVSTLAADPADTTDGNPAYTTLDGTDFAVDFNPVPDRLRVLSNTGKSYRINVDSGLVTTDGDLNGVAGAVVTGAAYINSFAAAAPSATRLLDLNQTANQLLLQDPPNNGTLSSIGALGITLGTSNGYDIAGGFNGLSLATVAGATGPSTLYRVNTTTGAAAFAVSVSNVPNAAASVIGTASTPALIDVALLLK